MTDQQHETQAAREVRLQLVDLVRRHGPGLLADTRRVRAMLADAVPSATAETNLVGLALDAGVAHRLRDAGADRVGVEGVVASAALELGQVSSVEPHDARWAVAAVAEALGLADDASAVGAPVNGRAHADHHTDPGPAPGSVAVDGLEVGALGRTHVAPPGSAVTIGREPGSTIVLESPAVSRRHARLSHGPSGWTFEDLGSTQGSFVGGSSVSAVAITQETEVTLGQGPDAVTVRLVPLGVARPLRPAVAAAAGAASPPTDVAGAGQRPGGALAAAVAARTELGRAPADTITVTVGGASRTVAPGTVLTVGREADNDLVIEEGTVSRHHLRIEHREGAWRLTDLGTTSGTWLDSRRVTEEVLAGEQQFRLGDAERGALLRSTSGARPGAGGPAAVSRRRIGVPQGARRPSGRSLALVGTTAAALVAGLVLWQVVGGEDVVPAEADAAVTRDDLARATVFLEAGSRAGSGVVVDSEAGLVLTNAHVAAPSAVGRGIAELLFKDEQPKEPEEIMVHIAGGLDDSAEPRFYAELVAVDGYLDVAVLRIDRKLSGAPVEADDLAQLVEVPLGDSDSLDTSDEISFIGYPAASDSKAPTFTTGVVSGPVQDDRLDDFRAEINTTATISFGNSGGLAFDESGAMVGIPTWSRTDVTGDPVFSSIRPINLALPVIDAARAGDRYTSPWARPAPRNATILDGTLRYADPGRSGGVARGCDDGPRDYSPLAISARFDNFPGGRHTDVVAILFTTGGEPVALAMADYETRLPEKGCLTMTFDRNIPPGEYDIRIGVGGDLRVAYDGWIELP